MAASAALTVVNVVIVNADAAYIVRAVQKGVHCFDNFSGCPVPNRAAIDQ